MTQTNLTALIDAYATIKNEIASLEADKKRLEASLAELSAGAYEGERLPPDHLRQRPLQRQQAAGWRHQNHGRRLPRCAIAPVPDRQHHQNHGPHPPRWRQDWQGAGGLNLTGPLNRAFSGPFFLSKKAPVRGPFSYPPWPNVGSASSSVSSRRLPSLIPSSGSPISRRITSPWRQEGLPWLR